VQSRPSRFTAKSLLTGIYTLLVGPAVVRDMKGTDADQYNGLREHPREIAILGLVALVALVAIPVLVALAEDRNCRRQNPNQGRHDPTPPAWQWAAMTAFTRPPFARVLTETNVCVGGYFADKSYAFGYPQPASLFLELGSCVTDAGAGASRHRGMDDRRHLVVPMQAAHAVPPRKRTTRRPARIRTRGLPSTRRAPSRPDAFWPAAPSPPARTTLAPATLASRQQHLRPAAGTSTVTIRRPCPSNTSPT